MNNVMDDRVNRHSDDAIGALSGLYGDAADEVWGRLLGVAQEFYAKRSLDLRERDRRRETNPGWFLDQKHVGYKAYADRLGGTLRGVADRIPHFEQLGVTFVHLLSVLKAREGENDGGFAVDDYTTPEPRLGTREDLVWIADELGDHGINLVLDLVLNHTSDQHEWARKARAGSAYHQNLYLTFPDRSLPDRFEVDLPEVFPTMAPGNFTWVEEWQSAPDGGAVAAGIPATWGVPSGPAADFDGVIPCNPAPPNPISADDDTPVVGVRRDHTAADHGGRADYQGRWVWTTFREFQWDLNWANPDVMVEIARVALELANMGVSVLRLDAIAFTWKRLGTDCQNQPEAHLIGQVLRAVLEIAAPATLLLAEAIVGPKDLVGYLGGHEYERNECQLAYHNQLMVQGWSLLASREVGLATIALNDLPTPPASTTWFTYVRNHDDIGWAIDDDHAARAGLDGAAHRRFLAEFYRGDFPGSFARGTAFSTNEAAADERTSGMAATLSGLTAAVEFDDSSGPLAERLSVDDALARHRFVHAIAYGWGGIPLLYMGDEFAQPDAPPDAASMVDSRWLHRPYWDGLLAVEAERQPASPAGRALANIIELGVARRRCRPLHGGARSVVIDAPAGVFAWRRRHPRYGELLGIANPSRGTVDVGDLASAAPSDAVDVLAGPGRPTWRIEPYGVAWITNSVHAASQTARDGGEYAVR